MSVKNAISVKSPPFRSGTQLGKTKVCLVLNSGGIGDYIHWTSAIRYTIDANPHIHGHIITPSFFSDLAYLWLGRYSDRFSVKIDDDLENCALLDGVPSIIPNTQQYANATGFHLFQLGFTFFSQISWIPKGYETVPEIKGDEADLRGFNLPRDYAVITVNSTADNRRLPSSYVNAITAHLLSREVTPIFLGKGSITKNYSASAPDGLALEGVIDLRERTSLREAACIMAGAKFVFGLDNGLLHLASCSRVPVIMIFTSVDPKLRVPPRREGRKTHVIGPDASLPCRFCNTHMRYIIGFDFKTCLYKDDLCIKGLDPKVAINLIEKENLL